MLTTELISLFDLLPYKLCNCSIVELVKFSEYSVLTNLKFFKVLFFFIFSKNFWACERACVLVLVSIYSCTCFQLLPNRIIASINFLCSSRLQRPIVLPVSSSIIRFFFNWVLTIFGGCTIAGGWLCKIWNKLHGSFGGIILSFFSTFFDSIFSFCLTGSFLVFLIF